MSHTFQTYECHVYLQLFGLSVVPNICYRALSSSCPHSHSVLKSPSRKSNSQNCDCYSQAKSKSLRLCNSIPSLPQHTYTLFHNFRNLLFKEPKFIITSLNWKDVSNLKSMCTPKVLKSLEHLHSNLHPM